MDDIFASITPEKMGELYFKALVKACLTNEDAAHESAEFYRRRMSNEHSRKVAPLARALAERIESMIDAAANELEAPK